MPVSDPDRDGRAVVPAGRLATVWPYPPGSPARPPAGWLQAAVEQLVTTHTQPGDPVLILTPPGPDAPVGGRRETPADRPADAGWSVARLGRRVQVRTVPARAVPPSRSGPDTTGKGPDDDRHSLVVTVVDPTRIGWFAQIDWSGLLAIGGTLAVVSRCESFGGWLIDPTVELSLAADRSGLALLDRIVLLEVPLSQLDRPATPIPAGLVAQRVHSDLLLFTAVNTPMPPAWDAA